MQWAFDKKNAVEARPIIPPFNDKDWFERFKDKFSTQGWWEGGASAPGEVKFNPNDPKHLNYLEMTYKDGASWRIWRYLKEFYVFGTGQNKTTFFDSSDIYLKTNVRMPKVWHSLDRGPFQRIRQRQRHRRLPAGIDQNRCWDLYGCGANCFPLDPDGVFSGAATH